MKMSLLWKTFLFGNAKNIGDEIAIEESLTKQWKDSYWC